MVAGTISKAEVGTSAVLALLAIDEHLNLASDDLYADGTFRGNPVPNRR
jgi:hypothetical protein